MAGSIQKWLVCLSLLGHFIILMTKLVYTVEHLGNKGKYEE